MENVVLKNKDLKVAIDKRRGIITSVKMNGDSLNTEFIGNIENTSYTGIAELNQWLGDIKFRTWDEKSNSWTLELTERSTDIRKTTVIDENHFKVEYEGKKYKSNGVDYTGMSRKKNALTNISVCEDYYTQDDAIYIDISVKNLNAQPLEIGEMSLPFVSNSDYTGIFEDKSLEQYERWRGIKQKIWHEQRVQIFSSVNGSSSYILLQRPKGDFPALLFQTVNGTGIEAAYQMDPDIGCQWDVTFEGPYYFSLFSTAARKCGKWKWQFDRQAYGINGNSSLILQPYEEKCFHFKMSAVRSLKELPEKLYEAGQVAVQVQPGMVLPIDKEVMVCLKCKDKTELIPVCNHVVFEKVKENENGEFWKIVFKEPGQKKIEVRHGKGKTNLFFYAIGNVEETIKKRADFIIKRHYYENPLDPYHRYHAFLPYDDMVEMLYTTSEESFQVAGLDEHCLPIPMFLAEKNTIYPDQQEINVLEDFIEDSLYNVLQQRDTFLARRSMYYEDKKPSDAMGFYKFTKEEAEDLERSFNYNLIANIYLSMYEIGKRYNMLHKRSADEYLEFAYQTAMVGFKLGENKFNGAPAGATIVELLDALKNEKHPGYQNLYNRLKLIAEENANSEYPFGSELYVDQTPHNQYEAMMKYFGYNNKLSEAFRVTLALRTGMQPAWFLYGNEKRGNVCCWYATPLNSRVLYDGFDETGDVDMLRLAYGGLFSFLTCIRSNGAAHGWYLFWPDRNGFDLRSLDTDMGMYGYLKSARSYVIDDPVFGISGYGCEVNRKNEEWIIELYDGIGQYLKANCFGLEISVNFGKISRVILKKDKVCEVYIKKNTHMESEIQYKNDNNWVIKELYE